MNERWVWWTIGTVVFVIVLNIIRALAGEWVAISTALALIVAYEWEGFQR